MTKPNKLISITEIAKNDYMVEFTDAQGIERTMYAQGLKKHIRILVKAGKMWKGAK